MPVEHNKIALFDSGEEGVNPGPLGQDHYADMKIPEYEYQLEELFRETVEDHPSVVRAESWDGRVWKKQDGRFVLIKGRKRDLVKDYAEYPEKLEMRIIGGLRIPVRIYDDKMDD